MRNPAGTFYGFDVQLLKLTQASTDYLFDTIFQNCSVSLDVETVNARATTDIVSATAGFEYEVQKSRGYSVTLGSRVGAPGANPGARRFGWEMTLLSVGVSVLDIYKVAKVSISKELAESRAARDALPVADGGLGGWKYPRVRSQKITVDIDALIQTTASAFEQLLSTDWQQQVAYSLTGGGITLSGNGTLTGGGFDNSDTESSQKLTLTGYGKPMMTVLAGQENTLLHRAFSSNLTHGLTLSRPGQASYSGEVFITEASFEMPDDAAMQSGTLTGYGPLLSVNA